MHILIIEDEPMFQCFFGRKCCFVIFSLPFLGTNRWILINSEIRPTYFGDK